MLRTFDPITKLKEIHVLKKKKASKVSITRVAQSDTRTNTPQEKSIISNKFQ